MTNSHVTGAWQAQRVACPDCSCLYDFFNGLKGEGAFADGWGFPAATLAVVPAPATCNGPMT